MSRYTPVSSSPASPTTSPSRSRRSSVHSLRRPSFSSFRFSQRQTNRMPDPDEMDAAFDAPPDVDDDENAGLLGRQPPPSERRTDRIPGDYDFERDYVSPRSHLLLRVETFVLTLLDITARITTAIPAILIPQSRSWQHERHYPLCPSHPSAPPVSAFPGRYSPFLVLAPTTFPKFSRPSRRCGQQRNLYQSRRSTSDRSKSRGTQQRRLRARARAEGRTTLVSSCIARCCAPILGHDGCPSLFQLTLRPPHLLLERRRDPHRRHAIW